MTNANLTTTIYRITYRHTKEKSRETNSRAAPRICFKCFFVYFAPPPFMGLRWQRNAQSDATYDTHETKANSSILLLWSTMDSMVSWHKTTLVFCLVGRWSAWLGRRGADAGIRCDTRIRRKQYHHACVCAL